MIGLKAKSFCNASWRPAIWRARLLAAFVILPACSHTAPATEQSPMVGADPTYRNLVAAHLKASFKTLMPSDGLEISEPRWTQSNRGWSWLACVHFQDRGHRRTYAVFFNESDVIDGRYAVQSDGCGAQTYLPFDLGSGGPRSLGDTGPLY